MLTKTHIILHHTAVSVTKSHDQFNAVKKYHINEKKWGDIAYQYLIEYSGEVKKGRDVNSVGAHCYQEGMNGKSIGICLAGNFDKDDPSKEQLESLKKLLLKLKKDFVIFDQNILPHRHFAGYKSCPGAKMSNGLIQRLLVKEDHSKPSEWAVDAIKWCEENKIATHWQNPQSQMTKEEMAVMMHRFFKFAVNYANEDE